MTLTLEDIRWCAEECNRQQTGPLEVAYMCEALYWARTNPPEPWTVGTLKKLGQRVEPRKNTSGFRQTPVTIDSVAIPVYDFDRQLSSLLEACQKRYLKASEAYQEFESLHPFIDGNGRVGALLYNYWLGWPNPLQVPPPYTKR